MSTHPASGWKSPVPSWSGASRSEDAPCHKPDGPRSQGCEHGQSGSGQRGFRDADCDGVDGLLPGVLVVLEYLEPDQAAGSDGVCEDEDAHPKDHFSLCHSPGVEVILGGWGCPLRVILPPPSGISRPAAGERRGPPGTARLDGCRAAPAEAAMASPLHVLGC